MAAFYTISLSGFLKLFHNNSRGFRKYMMSRECTKGPWTKESLWKIYNKFQKNIIFPKGFLFNCRKNIGFLLKSQWPLKNVKNQKWSFFGPRPIHLCHKTELKSRWTVPLRRRFMIVSKTITHADTSPEQIYLASKKQKKSKGHMPKIFFLTKKNGESYQVTSFYTNGQTFSAPS
jgi:hypothetical protein